MVTMAAGDESVSPWLKKTAEPSLVDNDFKDGYVDMLTDRRKFFNDLPWALKKIPRTATYKYKHDRDYEQLNKDVLHSDRVSYVIEQISKETKTHKSKVFKDAEKILVDMAHCFNMSSVRVLGYPLIKVLKRLHDHIYINAEGLSMVNELIQEYPVLLVPSHRSYFDFIILSIMCFHYDLPLPAIVAAQDFMSMFMVGTMLRNSGAFYIKRTFRSDKLYWAIFTEYVQTQLYNGDHLIEFFVEGTRSRTQKSYAPKLGMLAGSLEAYFKGLVPDIMIVPISISYDRVLEENLFAQELLGIPKPKESTSKLFKVFSILNENYGSIHVNISSPISVRKMATGKINRLPHSLEPRFLSNITDEEEALVGEIAYEVIWQQQRNMVLSVWCLVAAVMLQNRSGISVSDLINTVRWLKRHANNVGAYIDWPGNISDEEVVQSCLESHSNYIKVKDNFVTIAKVDHGDRLDQAKHITGETIADAATHMVLVIYRNQMVHAFVPYSLLSMIIFKAKQTQSTLSAADALSLFTFAIKVFANEFVLDKNSIPRTFEDTMKVLEHTGDITTDTYGSIELEHSITRFTLFLGNMLLPFITGYWALCKYIVHSTVDMGIGKEPVVRPKQLVQSTQRFILGLINAHYLDDFELLNLDLLNNAVTALRHFKVVYFEVRNGEKFVAARIPALKDFIKQLEDLALLPDIPEGQLQQSAVNAALQAQL